MILVTGGTGFLGAHLLYKLISKGERVRATYRANSSFDLIKKVFVYYAGNDYLFDKIEWVESDILDIYSISNTLTDIDKVYHVAAFVSYDSKYKKNIFEINVDGTANIINACLENNVKKLCYVSSIAALGETGSDKLIDESTIWEDNGLNSIYSISKYNAELEVWRGINEGLNAVIVSPSVIMGYSNWNYGSSNLYVKIYNGFAYYTMGSSGFVDVEDVCNIMIRLMNSDIVNDIFIVSAENICYKNLFEMIAKSINAKIPEKYATPFLTGLAWRLDYIKSKIARKPALLTRESARTSHKKLLYSNMKIVRLLDYKFKSISKTIDALGSIFLKEF